MKRIHIILTICLTAVLFSCNKQTSVWERTKVNEVKMNSFGFYKADNPSVLLKDYVINEVPSGNIVILLPESVDKSNLIARFTVGENDKITVGGTIQKSGETMNDFNTPIDYILSDGDNNAKYTVTISKGSDYVWTQIPFTINDSAVSMVLRVNPLSGVPYIMYTQSRPSSADQKAGMVRYENNQWEHLGEISDGRIGSNFDFTFNSTGVPYASFPDYTATTAQTNTVKKFDGGISWSLVGAKGLTTSRISYNSLAFVDDSKLLLFSTIDVAGGVLARRELGISTFESNTWTTNATIPGRASTTFGYFPIARKKDNAIYLAVFNASSPNSFSIYKYANNAWATLVDQWRDENATGMNIRDFDMDVDDEGNVYVALADNSSASQYKYRILKYTEASQLVTPLGNYIAPASGNLFSFDLTLSPTGTPYFFYRNSSNYPTIVHFDNDSQDWSTPYTFEAEVADELSFDFAPNGEAYVAYLKNRKLFVYKYSIPF